MYERVVGRSDGQASRPVDTIGCVHPIEHLRYVARSGGAPDHLLLTESLQALAMFSRGPTELLIPLRQLIVRLPDIPSIVVLGARMLHDLDPLTAGWDLVEEVERDPTAGHADALVASEGAGVDVIETIASGPTSVLAAAGTETWIESARAAGRAVYAVTPLATRLPKNLEGSFAARAQTVRDLERIDLDRFDELVGPDGIGATWRADCGEAPELAAPGRQS